MRSLGTAEGQPWRSRELLGIGAAGVASESRPDKRMNPPAAAPRPRHSRGRTAPAAGYALAFDLYINKVIN